jgi:putative GTP pyrophosphokinase
MPVEIQIRTIAMDFWASLEHKIHYKYRGEVPANLRTELTQAADAAAKLDEKMEALHLLVDRTGQTRPSPIDSLDLSALYANFMSDRG